MAASLEYEDLLRPLFDENGAADGIHDLEQARERARLDLAQLHPSIKRITYPHQYPVGLESKLHNIKTDLILRARGEAS